MYKLSTSPSFRESRPVTDLKKTHTNKVYPTLWSLGDTVPSDEVNQLPQFYKGNEEGREVHEII